jgi:hypothetical protein
MTLKVFIEFNMYREESLAKETDASFPGTNLHQQFFVIRLQEIFMGLKAIQLGLVRYTIFR